jgi:hypothetical protein
MVALLWLALVTVGTCRPRKRVVSGRRDRRRQHRVSPEGWNGKARTGTFVVKVNGEWVEAQSVMKTVPATTR